MTKEELQKSLDNIRSVIIKCKIMKGDIPLTGVEFMQLFKDLEDLKDAIEKIKKNE